MGIEDEIDLLETEKENMEYLIEEYKEQGPGYEDEIAGLEIDIERIDEQLDELYSIQIMRHKSETEELEREYWKSVL